MSTITINSPAYIKIENKSADKSYGFIPYRENFTTYLKPGKTLEFAAPYAGIALYYLKQAYKDLAVTQINALDTATDDITVLYAPAVVTLTNVGDKSVTFMPYKENFTHEIAVGDAVVLTTTTVGQLIYYISQGVENKLTVTFEDPNAEDSD